MRTKVINIDGLGIYGVEKLIKNNPNWQLITCGQTTIDMWASGKEVAINFAVFRGPEEEDFLEQDFSSED
jgi:hypothetical protein